MGNLRSLAVRVLDLVSGGCVARGAKAPGLNPIQDLKNEFKFYDTFRVSSPW